MTVHSSGGDLFKHKTMAFCSVAGVEQGLCRGGSGKRQSSAIITLMEPVEEGIIALKIMAAKYFELVLKGIK